MTERDELRLRCTQGTQSDLIRKPQDPHTRVCDRCRVKKLKCNLRRPSCSTCLEGKWECMYSLVKKRPGPAKGSRRKVRTRPGSLTPNDTGSRRNEDFHPSQMSFSMPELQDAPHLLDNRTYHMSNPFPLTPTTFSWASSGSLDTFTSVLSAEQRHELAQKFYETINSTFPLFRGETFVGQLEVGAIGTGLSSIIYAISARIFGPPSLFDQETLELSLSYLADTCSVEVESPAEPLALDVFRSACLLAFYNFHQHPGEKAFIKIALLSRKAYQCGLHQIDNEGNRTSFDWNLISDDGTEDWRHVWWCVFCLDSYSSSSIAAPFSVEIENVKTALLGTSIQGTQDSITARSGPSFIPPDQTQLWKAVQDLDCRTLYYNFNFHMILTVFLKEAVNVFRLQKQNPSDTLKQRILCLQGDLCAIRLALPRHYTDEARDVLGGETGPQYHARLLNIFGLHAVHLLLRFPTNLEEVCQWQVCWQQNLESCLSIVSVIQQWDPKYSLTVDPAVCFMAVSTLFLLHLHSLSQENSDQKRQERLSQCKNIIRLFLQSYAASWALPGFLVDCFDEFSRIVSGPLLPGDIRAILEHFHGPLHRKWLKFLSLRFDERVVPGTKLETFATGNDFAETAGQVDNFLSWINQTSNI